MFSYVGVPERALEFNEHNGDAGYQIGVNTTVVWQPDYRPLRKTERFKVYVRKAGMVDYWRARGWPDLCRPQGADDFVCD